MADQDPYAATAVKDPYAATAVGSTAPTSSMPNAGLAPAAGRPNSMPAQQGMFDPSSVKNILPSSIVNLPANAVQHPLDTLIGAAKGVLPAIQSGLPQAGQSNYQMTPSGGVAPKPPQAPQQPNILESTLAPSNAAQESGATLPGIIGAITGAYQTGKSLLGIPNTLPPGGSPANNFTGENPSRTWAGQPNPGARYSAEGNNIAGVMRSNSHFDMPAEAHAAVPALKEAASDLGVTSEDFKGMNGPTAMKRVVNHAIDINEARNVEAINPVRSLPADVSKSPELTELLGKKNPTVGDVDAFRLEANKKLSKSGYYGQSPSQQYSAGPDLAKLETAVGQARDIVYNNVEQHTGVDIRPQKGVESSLIKLNDVTNSTSNTLAQQEAKYQNTPTAQRVLGSVKRLAAIKANPTNAFEAGMTSPTDEFNSNMQKVFSDVKPAPGSVMKNGKLVVPAGQTGAVNLPKFNLNLQGTPAPEPASQLPLNLTPGEHGFNLEPPPGQTPPAPASQYGLPGIGPHGLDLNVPPQPTLTPPGPTQLPASPLERMKQLAAAPGEGRTTMSATEFNDALKNNRSMRTPFDYTEGARQTANAPGSEAAQRGRAAEIAKKYPAQSINPIRDPFAAPARAAEAPVSHNMIMDAEGKPDRLEIMKGDQPLGHLKIEEQIPGTWTVTDATVNQPGKGYGSGAYKQLISEAQRAGIKTIESDISNTSKAAGVWKSLQREFPKAVTEENGQYSMDVTRLKK